MSLLPEIIFQEIDILEDFKKYIPKTFQNQLEFLTELNNLKKEKEQSKIKKGVEIIYETYFKNGGKKEIPDLSSPEKVKLYDKIEEKHDKKTVFEAFDEVYNLLFSEIKIDLWPRYKMTRNYLKYKDKYINYEKYFQRLQQKEVSYTSSNFKNSVITENDINFGKYLLYENLNWELIWSDTKNVKGNGYQIKNIEKIIPKVIFSQNSFLNKFEFLMKGKKKILIKKKGKKKF
jgi:hypothetical protein